MNERDALERLGAGTALVLRWGTLLAMVAIGAGYLLALLTDEPRRGPTPLVALVAAGGVDALIGVGLLGLTMIPVAAVAVALAALAAAGERPRALMALAVLGLLGASLVAATLIGTAS